MTTPDALRRVHQALETLASALGDWQPDDVLAAEAPLAAAVRTLTTSTASPGELAELRRELINLRVLVSRCGSLGESAAQVEAAMFSTGYGARGGRLRLARVQPTIASRT